MAKDGNLHLSESKTKVPFLVFFKDARLVFKMDELGLEILRIAFPAALALAADPIASLVDTAFIGHIGPVELAAVGVSIAIFNQASRITVFPLVSITTSFVAEEDTVGRQCIVAPEVENLEIGLANRTGKTDFVSEDVKIEKSEKVSVTDNRKRENLSEDDCNTTEDESPSVVGINSNKLKIKNEKRHIPSASTALIIGGILGLIQTIFLIFGAKPLLSVMGVKSGSPMLKPALKYLTLRSLGAPAVLLSLAMQGVFRGFKDTKTPLYAIDSCGRCSKYYFGPNTYLCMPSWSEWCSHCACHFSVLNFSDPVVEIDETN